MSDNDKKNDDEKKEKSFWSTLPGILTAIAGIITAITGLLAALSAAGLLKAPPTPTVAAIITPDTPTPTPEPVAGATIVSEKDGSIMVYVPADDFTMGTDEYKNAQPVHTVYLDAFYIDKYEVTNTQYRKCVKAGACGPPHHTDKPNDYDEYNDPNLTDHPVVDVDWYQANAYCQWAGKRLPTEAEWEKAARGTDGRTYPWGETIDCDHAQYNECGEGTVPVGSKPKGESPYDAADMAGNVWEWVADWYDQDYYSQSPARNPPGPGSGEDRVLRGGSWDLSKWDARCAGRLWFDPREVADNVGFRCIRDSE